MKMIFYEKIQHIKTLAEISTFLNLCKLSWHVADVHTNLPEFQRRPESNNAILELAFNHYMGIKQTPRF